MVDSRKHSSEQNTSRDGVITVAPVPGTSYEHVEERVPRSKKTTTTNSLTLLVQEEHAFVQSRQKNFLDKTPPEKETILCQGLSVSFFFFWCKI